MQRRFLGMTAMAAALAAILGMVSTADAEAIRIGYPPSVWDLSDFHGMMGSGIERGLDAAGATTSS